MSFMLSLPLPKMQFGFVAITTYNRSPYSNRTDSQKKKKNKKHQIERREKKKKKKEDKDKDHKYKGPRSNNKTNK